MGKLTDTKLRAIKGTGKAFKLADGRGLYLYVSASGTRSWRMDYSYGGKRKTYTFGQYPDIPLSDVRNQHISFRQHGLILKLVSGDTPPVKPTQRT